MLHACFYTICLVFHYTLWHFYAISGTNLLTRCHSASSLFSAVFVFQKFYTGNNLGIGRNKFQNPYFSRKRTGDQTRVGRGARGQAHHEGACPPSWPRPGVVRPPGGPLTPPLCLFKAFRSLNPKLIDIFPRTVPQRHCHRRQISGDRSLCSGTLPG
jgi:hypothetical protein